ncbi:MAG: hypothetical protein MN733_40665, partial [Nitrososphaera sp.]|nr:hypothetical protein [Nitrososphaera sp.]
MRQWVTALAIGLGLTTAGAWAWASDPALEAEIEVLKDRLGKLERQLAQEQSQGISSIGEKAGLPTLELPSGLQGLQMSGYADIAYQYSFNEPKAGTTTTGRVFDTEAHGFTPHAFELALEKPLSDEMPIGF